MAQQLRMQSRVPLLRHCKMYLGSYCVAAASESLMQLVRSPWPWHSGDSPPQRYLAGHSATRYQAPSFQLVQFGKGTAGVSSRKMSASVNIFRKEPNEIIVC